MQDDSNPRLANSLETLSARIARLAIGLGIDLDNAQTLGDILAQPAPAPVPQDRRTSVAETTSMPPPTAERRVAHLREELRALVVLRYHLESISLENNGLQVTRAVLEQAHQHLLERGFKPGADGWNAKDWQLLR